MENISQQSDEIEVLKSIFEDQWKIDNVTGTYSIQIQKEVILFITLTAKYPSDAPPKYELLAPRLTKYQKQLIEQEFQNIFEEEQGNPIIFQWIEKLKEIILNPSKNKDLTDAKKNNLKDCMKITGLENIKIMKVQIPQKPFNLKVIHGPTIVDRKSVFQGHVSCVTSEYDIRNFMNYLLKNKKIAQATHNISAYRVLLANSVILQDCNDDGEQHASGRVLHLLQILKLSNIMVVISRWYGGIHLGPDRFKHINNAARQALAEGGFIPSTIKT